MSPEERERLREQIRARGLDPDSLGSGAGGRGQGRGRPGEAAGRSGAVAETPSHPTGQAATTFDALFAPLSPVESVGRVWQYVDGELTPLRVRTGVSDGQNTELLEGALEEGSEVVTNVLTGAETRTATPTSVFPGLGRGGFPGGGGGDRGGGGNRGGGR
jgi:hypothetical protein